MAKMNRKLEASQDKKVSAQREPETRQPPAGETMEGKCWQWRVKGSCSLEEKTALGNLHTPQRIETGEDHQKPQAKEVRQRRHNTRTDGARKRQRQS